MFIVFQIGAREHYAIPRALRAHAALAGMFTEFWVPPGHFFGRLPGARRLRDRYHAELAGAPVHAPNMRMLAFELKQRLAKRQGWPVILERNELFQKWAVHELAKVSNGDKPTIQMSVDAPPSTENRQPTLFSYSYAALEIFRHAKRRGWRTVLGQIDPGPEEERIVAAERERYRHLASAWEPAPPAYWENWRQEVALADRILVNSEWSRHCLLKEGVPPEKLEVVPLVYGKKTVEEEELSVVGCRLTEELEVGAQHFPSSLQMTGSRVEQSATARATDNKKQTTDNPFQLLFLGQINLRKGMGRLLDAMRLLRDEPVELTLAGPAEINPSAWADLPKVRWIGPVARSEVGRHYAAADLFILPTLSDGYAITQLEALTRGLPVMASRHCGAAVTHGRNGWILQDLEAETIATAIRMAMLERPFEIRPPEFSLDDLAARLLTPYS